MNWTRLMGAAMLLLCGVSTVLAQTAAGAPPDDGGMMAKDVDPGWEAATVKPGDPNDTSSTISIHRRRVTVKNEPVMALLKFAYSVQGGSQIVDAPEWMKTERWDVSGVPDAPGKPNLPQFQSMMRKLLAERFGLKLHKEQREMPVFALTVAKGGVKLEKSVNQSLGPGNNGGGAGGIETHHYTNTAMPDLALMLMIYGDRPIVDRTGLEGRYDFDLRWTKDETSAAAATTADAPPGLFTAVQEQLGLKLEATKAMADVVVIDKVERPEAN